MPCRLTTLGHRREQNRHLTYAGATDIAPDWTPDQIAGLLFGAFMLASVWGASKVDAIIARQQRRQLGICVECGGLNEPGTCQEAKCPLRQAGGPQQMQETP